MEQQLNQLPCSIFKDGFLKAEHLTENKYPYTTIMYHIKTNYIYGKLQRVIDAVHDGGFSSKITEFDQRK